MKTDMINFATKHNDPDQKLSWAEKLGYGVGGGAIFMLLINKAEKKLF